MGVSTVAIEMIANKLFLEYLDKMEAKASTIQARA